MKLVYKITHVLLKKTFLMGIDFVFLAIIISNRILHKIIGYRANNSKCSRQIQWIYFPTFLISYALDKIWYLRRLNCNEVFLEFLSHFFMSLSVLVYITGINLHISSREKKESFLRCIVVIAEMILSIIIGEKITSSLFSHQIRKSSCKIPFGIMTKDKITILKQIRNIFLHFTKLFYNALS